MKQPHLFTLLSICLFISACTKGLAPSHSVEVATKGLHAAAISDDGQYSVVGSIYHGASLWRLDDNERLFNWNHKKDEATTVIAADFSDDHKWALTAAPHTLVLWDTHTGKGERFWTPPAEILDVELNAKGSLAILGLSDQTAVIFDIRRGGVRRVFGHQNRVRSVDFNREGNLAITGSEDFSAAIWDTHSGELLSKITHEDDVQLVKLSNDGAMALSVSKYDKALIWKTDDAERIAEVPLKAERLKRGIRFTAAQFSDDNQWLLTGSADQTVQLWQISPMQEVASWRLPKRNSWKPTSSAVLDVAFSQTPNTFIAVGSNGFIHTLKRAQ